MAIVLPGDPLPSSGHGEHAPDTVVVLGAGAVGLSAVMASRLTGADTSIAADIVPQRLHTADEVGATHTVISRQDDLAQRITDITRHAGATHIVETADVPLLELTVPQLGVGGTVAVAVAVAVAVVGAPAAGSGASFDINSLIDGRTICGVTEGASDRLTFIPALIDLNRQGRLPFDRFIRSYTPDRLHQASPTPARATPSSPSFASTPPSASTRPRTWGRSEPPARRNLIDGQWHDSHATGTSLAPVTGWPLGTYADVGALTARRDRRRPKRLHHHLLVPRPHGPPRGPGRMRRPHGRPAQ